MDADELVLELAAQRLDVLLPLEVGVDAVGQEQPRLAAGDRQAEAGQVVQLSEHARERRLAAVVRPADDEYPLGSVELEVVARPPCAASAHQLVRQRDVERLRRRRRP